MKSLKYAPIALFVYNRPEHARMTVEALKENTLARSSELIVFSDGPRSDMDAEGVRRTREYIHAIEGFRTVRIVERAGNMGLARSIIDGVTAVVNEYGRIIVLEDDLVTAPNFLEYMNDALEKYSQDERVMQVSGYMFPVSVNTEQETFLLPLTTSWGWATWQRAWRHFDADGQGYDELRSNEVKKRAFDLGGAYPYFQMLEKQMRGKIDSWAIRWWLSVFRRGGLALYPRRSLVKNIGFDGSGTHCGSHTQKQMELDDVPVKVGAQQDPQVNEQMARAIFDYLASAQGGPLVLFARKILNRLTGRE